RELVHGRLPLELPLLDLVELLLEAGRVRLVDDVAERLLEEAGDQDAELRREELPVVFVGVVAGLDRGEDLAVRRRTSAAVFLQRLDQRRLGVPRRRLREVLLR